MTEIYQGFNIPLIVLAKEDVSSATDIHAKLYNKHRGKLKEWGMSDVRVDGHLIILPIAQKESCLFPVGESILDALWVYDGDDRKHGITSCSVYVREYNDHTILGADGLVTTSDIQIDASSIPSVAEIQADMVKSALVVEVPIADSTAFADSVSEYFAAHPIDIPTKVSQLDNDSNYVTTDDSRLSDARTPTAHVHVVEDIDGIQTILDEKQPAGDYVLSNDARLSDERQPVAHTHPVSDISGLSDIAISGDYSDLVNKPTIPPEYDDTSIKQLISDEAARATAKEDTLSSSIDTVRADIAQKADADDVYTKTETSNLLAAKQDAPTTAGTSGQVLGLDDDLAPVWVDQSGGSSSTEDTWELIEDVTLTESVSSYSKQVSGYSKLFLYASNSSGVFDKGNIDIEIGDDASYPLCCSAYYGSTSYRVSIFTDGTPYFSFYSLQTGVWANTSVGRSGFPNAGTPTNFDPTRIIMGNTATVKADTNIKLYGVRA